MAIIAEVFSDDKPTAHRWSTPANYVQLRSPVPVGLITFAGTDPIATLVATNQIRYALTITMPKGAAYLPRSFLFRYNSDDVDESWDADGVMDFTRTSFGDSTFGAVGSTTFGIHSQGSFTRAAAVATRMWVPSPGSPKLLLQGGDTYLTELSNMDAGAGGQAAGDMIYWHDWYVFNLDQIDKWEINTPIPVISHVSF